jgi:hypothetical protein
MADCFLTEQQHQTRNSDVGVEADSSEIGFQKWAPPTTDRRRCITKEMAMMQMEISSLALTVKASRPRGLVSAIDDNALLP